MRSLEGRSPWDLQETDCRVDRLCEGHAVLAATGWEGPEDTLAEGEI